MTRWSLHLVLRASNCAANLTQGEIPTSKCQVADLNTKVAGDNLFGGGFQATTKLALYFCKKCNAALTFLYEDFNKRYKDE